MDSNPCICQAKNPPANINEKPATESKKTSMVIMPKPKSAGQPLGEGLKPPREKSDGMWYTNEGMSCSYAQR